MIEVLVLTELVQLLWKRMLYFVTLNVKMDMMELDQYAGKVAQILHTKYVDFSVFQLELALTILWTLVQKLDLPFKHLLKLVMVILIWKIWLMVLLMLLTPLSCQFAEDEISNPQIEGKFKPSILKIYKTQ